MDVNGQPRSPVAAPPLAAEAVAGVSDATLRVLLAEHWDAAMRTSPEWATELGDHRFDDELRAADAGSIAAGTERDRVFLARAQAINAASLNAADRVTLALFIGDRRAAIASADDCHFEQWSVTADNSLFSELNYLVALQNVTTPADGDHLLSRIGKTATLLDDTIASLRIGLAQHRVSSRESIRRAMAQVDRELGRPVAEWAMASLAREPNAAMKKWPDATRDDFSRRLIAVVGSSFAPALQRYRTFLHDELLPAGRDEAHEGLAALDLGAKCYAAMIQSYLGEVHTPEELHALGEREIARTDARLASLGVSALHTADLRSTLAALRDDKTLFFRDGDEIVAAATVALARAKAAIPRFFHVLPKAECIVEPMLAYEAPFSPTAFYRPLDPGGRKPGEVFVNTFEPQTRPRYELAALIAHEGIPGHHLQIAIAQELGAVPAFRKYGGITAFVEGWALYSETLAEEMGLYSSDLDRLGQASYDAWRAARLVIDTGLHAQGWTRAQAEKYLRDHTAASEHNISNEVDRYIGTPGQALAYKVGQLKILELRARAEAALGKKFDLATFHDIVLGAGAVTLPVLEQRIDDYIRASI